MSEFIIHSAKGTTWKKHKYIKIVGGRYVYAKEKIKDAAGSITGHTQKKRYEEARKNALKTRYEYNENLRDYRDTKDKFNHVLSDAYRIGGDKTYSYNSVVAQNKILGNYTKALQKSSNKTLVSAKKNNAANAAAKEALRKYKKTPLYKIRKLMGKEK